LGRYEADPDYNKQSGHDLTRRTGFKKNVNRATTQVMMKTGEFEFFTPQWRWIDCDIDRDYR
jgi:hypothetical protein